MIKRALGKGVDALFSTEKHEEGTSSDVEVSNLEDKTGNLEVISSKLKPHNVEDPNSNSEVISSNLEDKTENLEVISFNQEDNVEVIPYNLEVVREALADAKQNPRISLWSHRSAAVLRYLRKTKPEFSISEEAGLLLEAAIKERYPELLEQVEKALAKR